MTAAPVRLRRHHRPLARWRLAFAFLLVLGSALAGRHAHAFCGFYVGQAGAELWNEASQVVLVRDGERTVVTMSNDYQGNLKDFALVVPVPTVLEKDQIHVGERRFIEHLDAYSAPRLVEYYDPDPCAERSSRHYPFALRSAAPAAAPAKEEQDARAQALGVTVEARYTVGEYDIVMLSAKQSDGLETFLRESGYQIPDKASRALRPYIQQGMKFFVAKVNLREQKATGVSYLRPIQIAYESPKFMLPIRLGMANARGAQDLVVYALTRRGRVESTNYRTTKIPSDKEVPLFVKDEFGPFYRSVFEREFRRQDQRALHTEYVWDMGWCDPCSAPPLATDELRGLGVFWLDDRGGGGAPVLTRLHVRYDGEHFPEDLVFQETGDRQNFQARYVLRHPFEGATCSAVSGYRKQLDKRHRDEAATLADLTGWSPGMIAVKMGKDAPAAVEEPWYRKLWRRK
jgi:hypothetical protein